MCHGSHIYIPILYLVKTLYAKKIEFIYNTQLSFDFHKSRNCTVYVYQKQNAEKKDFIEEACYYKFSVIIFCLKMTFLIYGHQKEVHNMEISIFFFLSFLYLENILTRCKIQIYDLSQVISYKKKSISRLN